MATFVAPLRETLEAPSFPRRMWLRAVLPAICTAFAIRLIVVFFVYRSLPDADKFYEAFGWETGWVARAIASGRGFSSPFFQTTEPTAMVSPLYTYLLAGIFRLFGIYSLTSAFVILSINSLFSSLTCIPLYFSAKHALGSRGARLACWSWAFYPFAIYFSAGRVWEYSLTALLFTTCFCIVQQIHASSKWAVWLGFGLLYGITANSNPAVLSSLPFLLALALWKVRKLGGRWLLYGALTSFGVLAALTPWTVRNYRVLHVLCPIRDNYWSNIYVGNIQDNLPDRYPFLRTGDPSTDPAELQKFVTVGEVAYFEGRHTQAVAFIRHYPFAVGIASLRRFVMYWTGYWSFSRDYLESEPTELPLMFMLICVTAFMLRGAGRFWRENRSEALPYFVLIAVFPLTYYVTLALMDYRQPIEPAIIVLAVAGAVPFRRAQKESWVGVERAALHRVPSMPICPVCEIRAEVHLRGVEDPTTRETFDILRCSGCGLGQTYPMPSNLSPYYEDYHGARHGSSAQICLNRRIGVLRSAERRDRAGTLLDIGCGDGSFLLAARERGWEVVGTEFNPREARQRGLHVVSDMSEIADSGPFDCITLWHSLEHLQDPLNTLKTIRKLLSPTGVLLIAVPDNGGLQAALFGRAWVHLDVPRHLYHFGKTSLSSLLQESGFSPVRWRHQEFEYDLLGWSQSTLNRLLPTPNVFFHLLMKRSPCCSRAEKAISYLLGMALTVLAFPLLALGTLARRGGSLLVVAHPCEPRAMHP